MAHTRTHIKRERAQSRAYSQAVITEGGRIVWLAGQIALEDAAGKSLAGDFDGQVREVFRRLDETPKGSRRQACRHGDDDRVHHRPAPRRPPHRAAHGNLSRQFPRQHLITCRALARPELLVEVQGMAVVG